MKAEILQPGIENYVKEIFTEEINLTEITEYGIDWSEMLKPDQLIPLQGARFDLAFEGIIKGDRLNGVIKGVDYLEIRSDGKFALNIHATIITNDGFTISVRETGISTPDSSGKAILHLNMDFFTASSEYDWINKKQVWSVGEVDMKSGKVLVTGFSN